MKKSIIFSIAVVLISVVGCKKEEPQKVAVINMAKVFAAHPALKYINPKVNTKKSEAQQKIQKATEIISGKQAKLEELKKKSISADDVKKMAQEIYNDRVKLNHFVKQNNQKLGVEQKHIRDQLLLSVIKVVDEFRVENNYSMVLDYSGLTGNNMAAVVCFNKENDITETVLEKVLALNVKYSEKPKGAAAAPEASPLATDKATD